MFSTIIHNYGKDFTVKIRQNGLEYSSPFSKNISLSTLIILRLLLNTLPYKSSPFYDKYHQINFLNGSDPNDV